MSNFVAWVLIVVAASLIISGVLEDISYPPDALETGLLIVAARCVYLAVRGES